MRAYPRHIVNLLNGAFRATLNAIKSGEVTEGPLVENFEKEFARYIGVKQVFGLSSGRVAFHLALMALDLNEGDEIILPAYTFHGFPLIIKSCGLKPVFVDIRADTYNIDISGIENAITPKTKAVLVIHMFGQPCEVDRIVELAKRHGLKVIEDCAHACGAEYKGKKVGGFGDIAIFSFNTGKTLSCFGGGALCINDSLLSGKISNLIQLSGSQKRAGLYRQVFKTSIAYFATKPNLFPYSTYYLIRIFDLFRSDFFDRIMEEPLFSNTKTDRGTKISNLQAAVGVAQLKEIEKVRKRLSQNAELYSERLYGIKGLQVPVVIKGANPSWLYYCVKVNGRDFFRRRLLRRGIDTRKGNMVTPSSLQDFENYSSNCPTAEQVVNEVVELPNNIYLFEEDINYISGQIKAVMKEIVAQ